VNEQVILTLLLIGLIAFVVLRSIPRTNTNGDGAFKLRGGSGEYEVCIGGRRERYIVKATSGREAIQKVRMFIETKGVKRVDP